MLITDVLAQEGEALAAELGEATAFIAHDVTSLSSWHDVVAAAETKFGRLDCLVNNAGVIAFKRLDDLTEADIRRIIDVNLNSLMACASRYRQTLAERRGSIITISSAGGLRATRGNPAYAASKAGAIHLTATLAQAWARQGIRVNGVAPGLVDTKLTKVTIANEERLRERLEGIPAGRLGTPQEMADACLFLASPMASYIYGQTLLVDGGRTL